MFARKMSLMSTLVDDEVESLPSKRLSVTCGSFKDSPFVQPQCGCGAVCGICEGNFQSDKYCILPHGGGAFSYHECGNGHHW